MILEITRADYDIMIQHEAVIIREYEKDDGSRFGEFVAWGDLDEMKLDNETMLGQPVVIPQGIKRVSQIVKLTSELEIGDEL